MKIALSLIRLQSYVRNQVVLVLQVLLNCLHPVQNKISGPLGLPVGTNIHVNVLVEAVLGPVVDSSEDEFGRLRFRPPHLAHRLLDGGKWNGFGKSSAGEEFDERHDC